MHIREQLKQGRILTDGAMGTYFETKYPGEEQMAEACNISAPEKIKQIHLEYLQSGAQLIRTNTFAANTMFFEDIDMVKKLIQAGFLLIKTDIQEQDLAWSVSSKEQQPWIRSMLMDLTVVSVLHT